MSPRGQNKRKQRASSHPPPLSAPTIATTSLAPRASNELYRQFSQSQKQSPPSQWIVKCESARRCFQPGGALVGAFSVNVKLQSSRRIVSSSNHTPRLTRATCGGHPRSPPHPLLGWGIMPSNIHLRCLEAWVLCKRTRGTWSVTRGCLANNGTIDRRHITGSEEMSPHTDTQLTDPRVTSVTLQQHSQV